MTKKERWLTVGDHPKLRCCGCGACAAVCLVDAIQMQQDKEGFVYPHIDDARCLKCGLCVKVCMISGEE